MFSKPIFKQTLKANYKLWLVFTIIMCALSTVMIAVFDPKMVSSMMDMIKDTPMAEMAGDRFGSMNSVLGILSQSFYNLQGIILPLIFIIMTANSLVASQVDRGSMAYLLSTPITRSKVVRTQALYMITSVFTMFLVLTISGLFAMQAFHSGVFTKAYTDDVKAVATMLNKDNSEVEANLTLILNDDKAVKEGAAARGIDEDVYTAYLNAKLTSNAYQAAADILSVDVDKVAADPTLIKGNEGALAAAAKVMGMDKEAYSGAIDMMIAQKQAASAGATELQGKLMKGMSAAAKVLEMDEADLASDIKKLKSNESALKAAVTASEIPKDMYLTIINTQLANDEINLDKGIDFDVKAYIMLNLGAFLLMFAISSISFLFSCIFNLTKNSLTLGAGIPVAFFIFQIMAQVGDSLENFKYLSLNTLFNTEAIINGGEYLVQFIVLAVLAVLLYIVSVRWFKEKDLPL